jgi:RND family efflux transporter MFP subunit
MEQLSALFDLATSYHSCRDLDTLLKTFAAKLASQAGARSVLVWLAGADSEGLQCRARWGEAGERLDPVGEAVAEGMLAELLQATHARRLGGDEIDLESLVHLVKGHRERVRTALYAPIPGVRGAAGVVELLNKRSGQFTADDATFVEEACRITGPALETRESLEQERHSSLVTIERLTSLYDISRIFNSTLEVEGLLPVVAEKIGDIMGAQACNIWLPDAEAGDLYFAQQVGEDPTTNEEDRTPMGEGLIGEVAKSGKAHLIEHAAEEPLLARRQKASPDFHIRSAICVPLLKDTDVLGVVEIVNKQDGTAFTEEDLFFLSSICEQAAIALYNANLLVAERKLHALDALLTISKEITSTLDLDHVLTTVVHHAATVVSFDRCVIGLFDRNRFILSAVSGESEVPKTKEMEQLRDALAWVAQQTEPVSADQYEEGWKTNPEEAKLQITGFLTAYGCNGFYAVPLRDEQGTLGVMALLSGDAEFLSASELEIVGILTNHLTVAIRNAMLYQQVPLVSFLKPLAARKRQLESLSSGRWIEFAWKTALVVLLLIVVPWRMRVGTNAAIVPAEHRVVSAEVGGVINRVLVHEGDKVAASQPLAQLDDGEFRVKLAAAQASLGMARRDQADAEFRGEMGAVDQARLRMQMYQAEADLYRDKVEKAQLRAPIAGVVVTSKVEEKVGKLLAQGEAFCELMEQDQMAAEMNVPETDVALLKPGDPVDLKLNSFPTYTFDGKVERIGAKTLSAEGEQFFVIRGIFPNPEGHHARDGMAGRAKISASGGWFESGWYPVGFVLLRAPARWAWQKAWDWLP